jgi:hypothetical protein
VGGGSSSIRTRTSVRGDWYDRLPEYPGLSLEAVKPVFGREEIVYTMSRAVESVSDSE